MLNTEAYFHELQAEVIAEAKRLREEKHLLRVALRAVVTHLTGATTPEDLALAKSYAEAALEETEDKS